MSGAIRFQYLSNDAERPSSGYLITDVPVEIKAGMPIPRVGEIVRHYPVNSPSEVQQFIVLSVHYDIFRSKENHQELHSWLVTVTLGDIPEDMDTRLFDIRD
ncbi:hypothetical protein ICN42_02230 [Polynucleobacter sp. 71A-WALBACH]|uniref:hypothetical protein n=1 Tax=Polynucleobacter sp. 71A-WALBACH TaxID=2689097 RepID=UPI001C0E49BF|nr:hypothetical protein [Polynucleobacter sp. 71A-WALBACH]MBU3592917.1 hypothetical protein [Polynucleobacter sp. 71A-WALBACH]